MTQFLQNCINLYPQHAQTFDELDRLYSRKLWHQLTELVEKLTKDEAFSRLSPNCLLEFYDGFVKEFETKINPLRLSLIAVRVSQNSLSLTASFDNAYAFIDRVLSKTADADGQVILRVELATLKLRKIAGSAAEQEVLRRESRALLDLCKTRIDNVSGLDSVVNSTFYRAFAEYHKKFGSADDFYNNALLFLSYSHDAELPLQTQISIAFEIAIAGLLGDHTFNFGELLQHPIVGSLKDSIELHKNIYNLLILFSNGNIQGYEALEPALSNDATISGYIPTLQQKIRLLALMELVFTTPPNDRSIPFATIASHCKVGYKDVEFLLMKGMSINLVKGSIDQVSQVAVITWVQPRVLSLEQVAALKQKIAEWSDKVGKTFTDLNEQLPSSSLYV